ncbi:polysaccharide pyruvyl transferase family protein [Bacteroidales bacterium SW292]|nr:polysaccharide pyruvyl transferase family protein [Bacteroidales bacterium SW292]
MKISLLTIWHERNYGAEMQIYATIRALRELGYEVEVVDIRLSDVTKPSLKGRIGKCIEFFSPAEEKFREFWKRYIPTTKRYHSLEQLQATPPQADVYLVGSDQVWNPQLTKTLAPVFFLNFGSDTIKRFSYASSFGTNTWEGNAELTKLAQKQLQKFEAVSCREANGIRILKDIFHINAAHVLDPTLLHKDYRELTGMTKDQNTLVYYPLSPFSELETFCKELAIATGKEYINCNEKKYLIGKIVWQRPGVEEWVKHIAEASLVVTPSFHGLAFSLIYHRQFIIVQNANGGKVNSRITNILETLGLSGRFFSSINDARKAKVWEQPINYNIVESKLQLLRDESYSFLRAI